MSEGREMLLLSRGKAFSRYATSSRHFQLLQSPLFNDYIPISRLFFPRDARGRSIAHAQF